MASSMKNRIQIQKANAINNNVESPIETKTTDKETNDKTLVTANNSDPSDADDTFGETEIDEWMASDNKSSTECARDGDYDSIPNGWMSKSKESKASSTPGKDTFGAKKNDEPPSTNEIHSNQQDVMSTFSTPQLTELGFLLMSVGFPTPNAGLGRISQTDLEQERTSHSSPSKSNTSVRRNPSTMLVAAGFPTQTLKGLQLSATEIEQTADAAYGKRIAAGNFVSSSTSSHEFDFKADEIDCYLESENGSVPNGALPAVSEIIVNSAPHFTESKALIRSASTLLAAAGFPTLTPRVTEKKSDPDFNAVMNSISHMFEPVLEDENEPAPSQGAKSTITVDGNDLSKLETFISFMLDEESSDNAKVEKSGSQIQEQDYDNERSAAPRMEVASLDIGQTKTPLQEVRSPGRVAAAPKSQQRQLNREKPKFEHPKIAPGCRRIEFTKVQQTVSYRQINKENLLLLQNSGRLMPSTELIQPLTEPSDKAKYHKTAQKAPLVNPPVLVDPVQLAQAASRHGTCIIPSATGTPTSGKSRADLSFMKMSSSTPPLELISQDAPVELRSPVAESEVFHTAPCSPTTASRTISKALLPSKSKSGVGYLDLFRQKKTQVRSVSPAPATGSVAVTPEPPTSSKPKFTFTIKGPAGKPKAQALGIAAKSKLTLVEVVTADKKKYKTPEVPVANKLKSTPRAQGRPATADKTNPMFRIQRLVSGARPKTSVNARGAAGKLEARPRFK